MLARLDGARLILPGLATAHSHAFQRALRGRTQRRSDGAASFWSWRALMYELANQLTPETLYDLSRLAYAELAMAGVTAVGEFHYLHHQADGTHYHDRIAMAEAVVRAARDVGLRITLLRVLYQRAGKDLPAEGPQRRFADTDVEHGFDDVALVAKRFAADPCVSAGIAAHSIRAVPRSWLATAKSIADARKVPMHMHVAEQRREIDECVAEYGVTPVQVLADDGILGPNFVAVHATHLSESEIAAIGQANSFVCVCRTTERDLGDGMLPAGPIVEAGARLCTGVDSHCISDPFEEARAIELDERNRTQSRHAVTDALELLRAATTNGYAAIGMSGKEEDDEVVLGMSDPSLAGIGGKFSDEAVIFAASPRAVRTVTVAGQRIVENGHHKDLGEILSRYQKTMRALLG